VASVAELQRLELLAPDDVRTNFAKATFLTSRGLYAQAVSPLRKVVEASPRAEHYASLAIAHIMSGSLSEAADDIARGLEIDPAYGELYLYRALLNRLRYRPEDARADARRAVSLGIPMRRAEPLM
jgi:tetratricopeptide (TPR) repeat protein